MNNKEKANSIELASDCRQSPPKTLFGQGFGGLLWYNKIKTGDKHDDQER